MLAPPTTTATAVVQSRLAQPLIGLLVRNHNQVLAKVYTHTDFLACVEVDCTGWVCTTSMQSLWEIGSVELIVWSCAGSC